MLGLICRATELDHMLRAADGVSSTCIVAPYHYGEEVSTAGFQDAESSRFPFSQTAFHEPEQAASVYVMTRRLILHQTLISLALSRGRAHFNWPRRQDLFNWRCFITKLPLIVLQVLEFNAAQPGNPALAGLVTTVLTLTVLHN